MITARFAVCAGTALAVASLAACTPPPKSELFQVFRANPGDAAAAIEKHVAGRFPVGSNDAPLVAYLKAEQLKIRNRTVGGYNKASVTWGPIVCSNVIGVVWRTDKAGTITELSAHAGDTGCF